MHEDACDTLLALTDEDWLAAHRRLVDSGVLPESEVAYLFDPDRDPATVTVDELSTTRDPKEPDDD